MAVAPYEKVLEQRGVREELDVLEGAGDSKGCDLVRRNARDVAAVERQLARRGVVDAADQVEDRRLAGTVGADDREHLALADLEGDGVDGPDATELNGDVARREEAHRSLSDLAYDFCRRMPERRCSGKLWKYPFTLSQRP